MPDRPYSKRTVGALLPSGMDVFLWDDELHGFGPRLTRNGSLF